MSTIVSNSHHPALDVSEAERIDYLTAVAFMAAADNKTSEEELERLREMCNALKISKEGTQRVLDTARDPDEHILDDILERLGSSQMRYALLVDAISVARADGRFETAESDEVMTLADKLEIPRAQAILVYRYVATWRKKGKGPSDAKTTAKLIGAGIPAAALAVTAAAGAPLVAGVGLAAALGVSSYVSVKWLFRRGKNKKPKQKKRRSKSAADEHTSAS